MTDKIIINVEIETNHSSYFRPDKVKKTVDAYFKNLGVLNVGSIIRNPFPDYEGIPLIRICEDSGSSKHQKNINYPSEDVIVCYYTYELKHWSGEENLDEENEDKENQTPSFSKWDLPCSEFDGLWDMLVFEDNIKDDILAYIKTSLAFAKCNINQAIVAWNSVVLFHGPPGTGKTTLCKALAQKLSIRFEKGFDKTVLVEINSHSLFSKWFSESGKLVLKIFSKIKSLISDPTTFVCLLIDEVETLTHSRTKSMNSTEPSDSIRVVNAVLTQIDIIKNHNNVLIMATSNISGAIDVAFADRADLKRYIGLPSKAAIYRIYSSCIEELVRTKLISGDFKDILNLDMLQRLPNIESNSIIYSRLLDKLSEMSFGMSGRTLRKIPFLAYSLLNTEFCSNTVPTIKKFLSGMEKAIIQHNSDSVMFKNGNEEGVTNKKKKVLTPLKSRLS